ncbi:hypothetical protein [Thermoflexus sp.]|uniref:hypothetical protein n=1 Tax=Thermoflexus sp. TaxID=1969742 RepID=UPI0035E3F5BE
MKGLDVRQWKGLRNLAWFLGLMSLGISMILQGLVTPVMAGTSIVLDGYQITFLGVDYNSDQTSTWSYEVKPVSASKDLSHWVLALCTNHQVLSSDPPGSVGQDPTTGLWGIKWEQPLRTTDEPRLYTFVLSGWFAIGTTQVAVKAGRDPVFGQIDGPSCEPPTPTPTPTQPVPTSTPGGPTPTPTPQVEPPVPTPTQPAPTPTPIVYPPVPVSTPAVNPPPNPSEETPALLPVTGIASRGPSGWSLLLARLSMLFFGLGLAAHIVLTWRAHNP